MPRLLLSILVLALARVSITACTLSMSLAGACASPPATLVSCADTPAESASACHKPSSCASEPGDDRPDPIPRPSKCCEMLAADPAKTEPLSGHDSLAIALLPAGRPLGALAPQPTISRWHVAPHPWPPGKRRAILSVWTI